MKHKKHAPRAIKDEFGKLPIEVPRDRDSSVETVIIPKYQTRSTIFDDKIISLYTREMTTLETQGHLEGVYSVEVSPSLIPLNPKETLTNNSWDTINPSAQ